MKVITEKTVLIQLVQDSNRSKYLCATIKSSHNCNPDSNSLLYCTSIQSGNNSKRASKDKANKLSTKENIQLKPPKQSSSPQLAVTKPVITLKVVPSKTFPTSKKML